MKQHCKNRRGGQVCVLHKQFHAVVLTIKEVNVAFHDTLDSKFKKSILSLENRNLCLIQHWGRGKVKNYPLFLKSSSKGYLLLKNIE